MYIPVWGVFTLGLFGGALLTFLGMVCAVVISNKKKGE